jgi:hypothetical protein
MEQVKLRKDYELKLKHVKDDLRCIEKMINANQDNANRDNANRDNANRDKDSASRVSANQDNFSESPIH